MILLYLLYASYTSVKLAFIKEQAVLHQPWFLPLLPSLSLNTWAEPRGNL